jgi:large subunit ribosomal protein L10
MRATLRDQGIGYRVAKKTLVKRVLLAKGFKGELPALEGEVAVVSGKDPIAPSREVYAFVKRYKEALAILGGMFEGRFLNSEQMTEVATIPSREGLLAQIAQLFNSPISRLAIGLNQIAEKRSA